MGFGRCLPPGKAIQMKNESVAHEGSTPGYRHAIIDHLLEMAEADRSAALLEVLQDFPDSLGDGEPDGDDEDWLSAWWDRLPLEARVLLRDTVQFNPRLVSPDWPVQKVEKKGVPTGAPAPSAIANTRCLLDHMVIEARLNDMTHDFELLGSPIENEDAGRIQVLNVAKELGLNKGDVEDHIVEIAAKNHHHPGKDWIESAQWDGVDRIGAFMECFETEADLDPADKQLYLKLWMAQAVAALYQPDGLQGQGVLVLCGPQGCGKSRGCASLAPHGMVLGGVAIDVNNKDDVDRATGFWLVELGELDETTRRGRSSNLKRWLSAQMDVYRKAYGRKKLTFKRRTAYIATVNTTDFLRDVTGNRRWWVLPVTKVTPLDEVGIDMQQLWAQVRHEYLSGAKELLADPTDESKVRWWLTPEEIERVNELNQAYMPPDAELEKVDATFTFPQTETEGCVWMQPGEILADAMGYESGRYPHNYSALARKVGQHLRHTHKATSKTTHKSRKVFLVRPVNAGLMGLVQEYDDMDEQHEVDDQGEVAGRSSPSVTPGVASPCRPGYHPFPFTPPVRSRLCGLQGSGSVQR